MPAIKPPFPQNLYELDKFPGHENMYFEFKKNLQTYPKIINTVCGLLNRRGGYIVFGIDDESLEISGIQNTSKSFDEFALNIDKIFTEQAILTTDNLFLNPDNVILELVPHKNGLVVYLNITPTENTKYKLRNGFSYIRLNASTYENVIDEKMYRYYEVEHAILVKTKYIEKEKNNLEKKIMKINTQYMHLEEEYERLESMLMASILSRKKEVEMHQEVTPQPCSILKYIMKYFSYL
jgi:predicted HTH transcriptional regulator